MACIASTASVDGLQIPKSAPPEPMLSRRSVLGASCLAVLPAACSARNPLDFEAPVEYKQRNGPSSGATKKTVCEEGQRLSPDGFGGKKCVGEVKAPAARVLGLVDEAPSTPSFSAPTAPTRSKKASIGESTSSSKPLSFEELVANSIAQKESVIGRPLTEAERADLTAKVKSLMSL